MGRGPATPHPHRPRGRKGNPVKSPRESELLLGRVETFLAVRQTSVLWTIAAPAANSRHGNACCNQSCENRQTKHLLSSFNSGTSSAAGFPSLGKIRERNLTRESCSAFFLFQTRLGSKKKREGSMEAAACKGKTLADGEAATRSGVCLRPRENCSGAQVLFPSRPEASGRERNLLSPQHLLPPPQIPRSSRRFGRARNDRPAPVAGAC